MKKIDSDALGILNKALGLSGPGSQITELHDGIVDQALDVVPAIRRGRTIAGSTGIFSVVMRNIHAVANSQSSVLTPYEAGTTARVLPYPPAMPAQFDIWLFSAGVIQTVVAGTISASLRLQFRVAQQGLGINQAGGAVSQQLIQFLAFWDALATEGATFGLLAGSEEPVAKLNLRLPRDLGLTLAFFSTSSDTATFECHMVLGVFPVSLGQDCAV